MVYHLIKEFEKRMKYLSYSIEFINGFRRQITFGLIALYFLSLGFDIIWITTLFSISTLVWIVLEFPTSTFADYHSRKKLVIISFFLFSLSFFGIFYFKTFWFLAIFYIIQDIAWAFQSGISTAWIVDTLKYGDNKDKLVTFYSNFWFFEKIGWIIGAAVAFIIISLDFRFIWLLLSVVTFVFGVLLFFYMEEPDFKPKKSDHHFFKKTYSQIKLAFKYFKDKKNKDYQTLIINSSFATLFFSGIWFCIPLVLKGFGLATNNIALIFIILGVFSLVGALVAKKLNDKYGFNRSLFYCFLGLGIGGIFFALSKNWIIAILPLIFLNILERFEVIIYTSAVHKSITSEDRATLGSVSNLIWAVSNSASLFLIGFSITYFGLSVTMIIWSLFAFLTGLNYLIR